MISSLSSLSSNPKTKRKSSFYKPTFEGLQSAQLRLFAARMRSTKGGTIRPGTLLGRSKASKTQKCSHSDCCMIIYGSKKVQHVFNPFSSLLHFNPYLLFQPALEVLQTEKAAPQRPNPTHTAHTVLDSSSPLRCSARCCPNGPLRRHGSPGSR